MSVADKNRAIVNPFSYNDYPGTNDMAIVGGQFTDIALYLADMPKKAVSDLITIPVAATTTNNEISNFIPANSLVTSLGIFFTENVDAGAAGILSVGFGPVSADVSIVASTALNAAGENITINSFTSTSSKHKVETGGNAIAFASGSALWFGNQSSLFFQTVVGGNVLGATCGVKVVMEYITVSNS